MRRARRRAARRPTRRRAVAGRAGGLPAHRDNLAIALGQFLPNRIGGSLRRRLFFVRVRKAWKIVLLLAVIRADAALHGEALDQLERLRPPDLDIGGRRVRLAYIAALTTNLEALRRVEPALLLDAAGPGGWSGPGEHG